MNASKLQKTVVIDLVALTPHLLGEHTPFLAEWMQKQHVGTIEPVLPGVTCSAQYTYLTGKWPSEHGIVGNGWYFREEHEVKFWRQSADLVQAEKVWDMAKKAAPGFTCANMFWWYNMYSSADYSVTPRPMYPADGRKLPDCYSHPMDLRDRLQKALGQFPLFEFWGPRTTIRSSQWIANASKLVDTWFDPTLTLVYLPHLDYCLQKFGNDLQKIGNDLREIDAVCKDLISYFESKGAKVLLLSEYGITDVNTPVHINRTLRKAGYIQVKEELGLELLDAGASNAFAVADHQIAHVYIKKKEDIPHIKALLEKLEGVDQVLDAEGKALNHIDHPRAGELVAVAKPHAWFTYYYWLNDQKAPDFARTVDIHRKPGYDPVEMFADPAIPLLPLKIVGKLIKKKLGFRTLMDIIPLDASLIKGSHGHLTANPDFQPIFISPLPFTGKAIAPISVAGEIMKVLGL